MMLPNGAPTTDAKAAVAPRIPIPDPRSEGGAVRAMAVITQTNASLYPDSQSRRAASASGKLGAALSPHNPAATITRPMVSTLRSPNRFANSPAG